MSTTYKTPGVYAEESRQVPFSIYGVETSVAAFIGYTEKAQNAEGKKLVLKPTKIGSLAEYELYFGKARNENAINVQINDCITGIQVSSREIRAGLEEQYRSRYLMYYSLQLFFENGGGECYIISAGVFNTKRPAASHVDGDINYLHLKAALHSLAGIPDVSLIVFPEASQLIPEDYGKLISETLEQCKILRNRFMILDLKEQQRGPILTDPVESFRNMLSSLNGTDVLRFGAAYFPRVVADLKFSYLPAGVNIVYHATSETGSGTTTEATDFRLKLSELIKPSKRLPKYLLNRLGMIQQGNSNSTATITPNAALISRILSLIDALTLSLPAPGAVAGVFASVDRNRGVWKSPAGLALNQVKFCTQDLTQEEQSGMNVDPVSGKSINAIRSFPGKGIMMWGARTLAGNDNEWRYIPVSRFVGFVETSVSRGTKWAIFEPNSLGTWTNVKAMTENFLTNLWRSGALAGLKPEQAFYVHCGEGTTMSEIDVLEGRMIIEIGLAVVRPAEFINLRIFHSMQS